MTHLDRDPSPWHIIIQHELERARLHLIDKPELSEPWRRRARLTLELLALVQQQQEEQHRQGRSAA